jgi:regulator of protease activity HflC (stomatin/prohibitin superfamily)
MDGINAILGGVALLGVLIFLAGIGLAIMSASQNRPIRGGLSLAIIGIVLAALFSVIGGGLIVVEPTEVAVVVNTLTGEVLEPKRGGTHIIVPFMQRVTVTYPITQLDYTMAATSSEGAVAGDAAIEGLTKDGQKISLDVTVLYRIPPNTAGLLYQDLNENYIDSFVRPVTRAVVREATAKYTAEEIYSEARESLGNDIQAVLSERFTVKNMELTDLLVRLITFSPEFTQAIEEKVVADQNLQRARIDAERAETEATGRANATIAAATGDAESTKLRAAAEAEALRLINEQISQNPNLIQYLYVQNLSDNVSLVLLPSNSPFLFDFKSLGGSSFTPPDTTTTPGG